MDTRKDLFDKAYDDFVPGASDHEAAIPYYRAFAGLQAAWGKEFCDQFNTAIHQTGCICGLLPKEQIYAAAILSLQSYARDMKEPPPAYHEYFDRSMPEPPTEKEAYAYFRTAFKRTYPDRRINSKFAKETWEKKRAKCMELVTEEYRTNLEIYHKDRQALESRNETSRKKYQDRIDEINKFRAAVADLSAVEKTLV